MLSSWQSISGQILKWYRKALIGPKIAMSPIASRSMIQLMTSSKIVQLRKAYSLVDRIRAPIKTVSTFRTETMFMASSYSGPKMTSLILLSMLDPSRLTFSFFPSGKRSSSAHLYFNSYSQVSYAIRRSTIYDGSIITLWSLSSSLKTCSN